MTKRPTSRKKAAYPSPERLAKLLEEPVAFLGLSVRTVNALEEHEIFTVEQLLHQPPSQLLAIPNFGTRTLEDVYAALAKIGLHRKRRRHATSRKRT